MSAPDRPLLGMLAAELTKTEQALSRIVKISESANRPISSRELRFYEIALEGLGKSAPERDHMLRSLVQRQSDFAKAMGERRKGGLSEEAN